MLHRDELTRLINLDIIGQDQLNLAVQRDFFLNGVQVEGREAVNKVAIGVTANATFLEAAIEWGADFCIFHHGIDTRSHHNILPAFLQKQLRLIFKNDLSIAYYHYSLDTHPRIGNNVLIAQALQAEVVDELFDTWGLVAKLETPKPLVSLKKDCQAIFNHDVLSFAEDLNKQVTTLGIVSGGATPTQASIYEMQQKGIELFISGEGKEDSPHKLLDSGIAYFLGGHYATEIFGVKALADELAKKTSNKVEVKFIDIPNLI